MDAICKQNNMSTSLVVAVEVALQGPLLKND